MVVFEKFYWQAPGSNTTIHFRIEASANKVRVGYLGVVTDLDDDVHMIAAEKIEDFVMAMKAAQARGEKMQKELKFFLQERDRFYSCSHCGELFYQVTGEPPDGGSRICSKCCDE